MKILFIADTHIGGERAWGISAERYDRPFKEAVDYACAEMVEAFVIAGDTHMNRNPTVNEHLRLRELITPMLHRGIQVVEVAGNHDHGTTIESIPGTILGPGEATVFGGVKVIDIDGTVQLVCLPWPRPVDYIVTDGLNLEDTVNATRAAVMGRLRSICDALDPTRPAVLTGHAMVSYGKFAAHSAPGMPVVDPDGALVTRTDESGDAIWEEMPKAPNLGVFGKDIVLPYEELRALPNISVIRLGHVHDPQANGYIGSTQPTDFGDVGQVKTFTVLDFDTGTPQPTSTVIPYETSLKIDEIDMLEVVFDSVDWGSQLEQVDIRRVKVAIIPDSILSEEDVRDKFRELQTELRVEIVRERIERQRVETATPVGQMDARTAFETWCRANDVEATDHARLDGLFVEMLEAVDA